MGPTGNHSFSVVDPGPTVFHGFQTQQFRSAHDSRADAWSRAWPCVLLNSVQSRGDLGPQCRSALIVGWRMSSPRRPLPLLRDRGRLPRSFYPEGQPFPRPIPEVPYGDRGILASTRPAILSVGSESVSFSPAQSRTPIGLIAHHGSAAPDHD